MTIVHSRPDGSRAKSHVMKAVTIAPGAFFTLGNSAADLLPAYIDYGYSADLGDMFNSDGGQLALSCGKQEIDRATYESVKEGRSRQLTAAQPPDYTLNDDPANWCEAVDSEFETGNFGTPGSDSDCTPVVVGQCNDNGTMRASVLPAVGDLVITEVMPNPGAVSDTVGEWFEILAINDFDLNGVGLDRAGDSSNPNTLSSPDCLHVSGGEHVIFVKSTDMAMNGGLPAAPIAGTFSFSLVDGTMAAPGDVRIVVGTNVIDAITWVGARSGRSISLDPDFNDPAANDIATNFCDGSGAFGAGDMGTPGEANAQCQGGPVAGMCLDNGTARAIRKPAAGALKITEYLANPAGTVSGVDGREEWFEIQNTGTASFDLNELGLKGNAATINVIQSADCKPVAPNAFALFAHSTDPTVTGIEATRTVDATFSFALANGSASTPGTITILDGVTPLDMVSWTASVDGKSQQVTPAPGCTAQAGQTYGPTANLGTPKAANVCP